MQGGINSREVERMMLGVFRTRSRRRFVLALAATLACSPPFVAQAQRRQPWKVGLLMPNSTDPHFWNAFKAGLAKLGYTEGRDVIYVPRSAEGDFARLPVLAQELVGAGVDVIVTGSTPGVRAAKSATAKILIVIATAGDPVKSGLVASFAGPGGNITGVSNMAGDTSAKMFELAQITLPRLMRIGVLRNPANPTNQSDTRSIINTAAKAGIAIIEVQARAPQDVDAVFATLAAAHAEALLMMSDPFLISQRKRIADLALLQRIPVFAPVREAVQAGALMSYGTDYAEHFRRAAYFVDRILKGAMPGDLPIEQAATFELVVNRKTAAALGVKIPQEILLRATEAIE